MLTHTFVQFTIYSSGESQWVGVMHLALAEKGLKKDIDYNVKEISLCESQHLFSPCIKSTLTFHPI